MKQRIEYRNELLFGVKLLTGDIRSARDEIRRAAGNRDTSHGDDYEMYDEKVREMHDHILCRMHEFECMLEAVDSTIIGDIAGVDAGSVVVSSSVDEEQDK